MSRSWDASSVNRYLAHKQHLMPGSRLTDVLTVTRDIGALHATDTHPVDLLNTAAIRGEGDPRPVPRPDRVALVGRVGVAAGRTLEPCGPFGDPSAVLTPANGFACFAEFFARRLRPEARPVCREAGAVVSPCDAVGSGR